MSVAADGAEPGTEQDRHITGVILREGRRLLQFIRKRVEDEGDAEDILQEVFFEFTEAYRLMKPVEHAGAWLYRVARNRIIDRFRKKKPEAFGEAGMGENRGVNWGENQEETLRFEELLPSPDAGPEAAYARGVLLDELEAALEELPVEQRDVFVAHQIEGRSFKELAGETGLSINTLLARKRYAVLHLRHRLKAIYEELKTA